MNLLSNAGTQALASYWASGYTDKYTGTYHSNYSTLSGLDGFAASSIFENSSGIAGSSNYNCSYSPFHSAQRYGRTGLNLNGPVPYNGAVSRSLEIENASNGSSIISNFFTSIQNVALGEYAPTSIAEQRLNYHLPIELQNKPGATINTMNTYLGLTSSQYTNDQNYNNAINSSYNVFAAPRDNVSNYLGESYSYEYMSNVLNSIGNTSSNKTAGFNTLSNKTSTNNDIFRNTMRSGSASSTSQMMQLLA